MNSQQNPDLAVHILAILVEGLSEQGNNPLESKY